MNADKTLVLNRRSSAFIGGNLRFGFGKLAGFGN